MRLKKRYCCNDKDKIYNGNLIVVNLYVIGNSYILYRKK